MDPKQRERLEARGIRVSLGTQEEADSMGILIYSVGKRGASKKDTPEIMKEEPPDEEQLILHRKYEESLVRHLQRMGHIPPEKSQKK